MATNDSEVSIADIITATDDVLASEPMWDKTKSVHEWLENVQTEMKILRGRSPRGIFADFVTRLLSSQSNEKAWWQKVRMYVEFYNIWAPLPRDDLALLLKMAGYRFWPRGAHVIAEARNVFEYELDYDWDSYFRRAEARARDGFLDDSFLQIKGVGRKTRDLALTDFTLQYPVIDVHVRRVMARTGLAGDIDIDLRKDAPGKREYTALRQCCFDLADENGLLPAELDRLFWHFGRTVCKKTPLCSKCFIAVKCHNSEKAKSS